LARLVPKTATSLERTQPERSATSISPVSPTFIADDSSAAPAVAANSSLLKTQIGILAFKDEIKLSKEAISLIAFGGAIPPTPSK
jgi:hypothetical protein